MNLKLVAITIFAALFWNAASADLKRIQRTEALRIAQAAAESKGYKAADLSAPRIQSYTEAQDVIWEVKWDLKLGVRRTFSVLVHSATKHADVYPLGFFLYAWRPGNFKIDAPQEIMPFVESNSTPIELESNDFNGDGRSDYLLVVEDDAGRRALLILIRQSTGTLILAGRNEKIIECSACGGTEPDAFDGIDARYKSFVIYNSSGDATSHLSHSYSFRYSKRDETWELVAVDEDGARYTPPTDFGLIKFDEFDGNYLGRGTR
ncbi:hypothetical protein [Nevskia soli]|uniref:hypothetical protein n=1 Tax=Nevskia soli TaxID=418856 RepID=UPI0012FCCE66|nr:hypothetical protein [Nevskia soli]